MERLRHLLPVGASCVVAALAVLGCADAPAPRPPAAEDGWSGRAVLCGYRASPDPLTTLRPGEVLPLGDDPAGLFATARCAPNSDGPGGGGSLQLRPEHSYFAVFTGGDRVDVVLVDVDAAADPVELVGEHHVVGPGCGRTAEYRGQLVLLIEGPADASNPAVRLVEVPLEC